MRFAGTATTKPATLPPLRPGKLCRFAQARRHVTQPRNLHLRTCRTRTRIAMEYLKDDHGSVHHLTANFLLEVARLRWRNLVINKKDSNLAATSVDRRLRQFVELKVRRFIIHKAADFLALANAQIGRLVETGTLLHKGVHNPVTQRFREFSQLGQRRLELDVVHARQLNGGYNGAWGLLLDFTLHSGIIFLG